MFYYTFKVPDLKLLQDKLNYVQSLGATVDSIVTFSGILVIIATSEFEINGSFLLLEDGTYLLQEDSGKILL